MSENSFFLETDEDYLLGPSLSFWWRGNKKNIVMKFYCKPNMELGLYVKDRVKYYNEFREDDLFYGTRPDSMRILRLMGDMEDGLMSLDWHAYRLARKLYDNDSLYLRLFYGINVENEGYLVTDRKDSLWNELPCRKHFDLFK